MRVFLSRLAVRLPDGVASANPGISRTHPGVPVSGAAPQSNVKRSPFVAGGTTFGDVLGKPWQQFNSHVKGRAVRVDGAWDFERVDRTDVAGWIEFMVFKVKKHTVDSSNNEQDWNIWLQSMHDKTVTLLIYDYGIGLDSKHDREAFRKDCVRPAETLRAGAIAEVSLREVVGRL
ncbi:unnamed protein product [Phytophthora fragariaefolia]|uniref:Unnamed protein product n=1 Tax=Phytophthora fragariaefolia TaxID=1490495 RepID=A0A9W6XG75_9STRA|nr:unnamed protein product [Phytophthora fragariaefolia]